MKTGEAERWLRQQLSSVYEEREAAHIAAMVLEKITGWSRGERVMQKEQPLVVQQLHQLTEYEQKLLRHEPVQYVLQEAWFYGLKLFVDRHVLIPRPETEELVHWMVQDIKAAGKEVFERRHSEADETTTLKILDVGTGSGCIALALKKAMPRAEVWACDVSEDALNVARRNGSELDIRVDFVGVDFLDEKQNRQLPTVDMIVSNPPYIPAREKEHMQRNVIDFEPHTALFVPDEKALIFYQALADFGRRRLHPQGSIYAEVHEEWSDEVLEVFASRGYNPIERRKDLQGKNRMIKAGVRRE